MKTTGDELLLAHLQVLSDEPPGAQPQARLTERVEPALAALLVRALRRRGATPHGARRL